MSPAIKLPLKLTGLRCLECSIWQMFLSWSFIVSMTNLWPRRSLSPSGINLFFIFDLRLVISSNPSSNSCSKSFLPRYPLSVKSLPVRPWHQSLTGVRSLTLPVVTLKVRSSPTSLTIRWSLNPKNYPRLDFPLLERPLKTLFLGIRMNCYRTRINLADACYLASTGLQIGRQWDQAGWHPLNKTMRWD